MSQDLDAALHHARRYQEMHALGASLSGYETSSLAMLVEIERLTAERRACNDLLAVIHRDGGHYTEQHGVAKSVADAIERVGKMRSERDSYKLGHDGYVMAAAEKLHEVERQLEEARALADANKLQAEINQRTIQEMVADLPDYRSAMKQSEGDDGIDGVTLFRVMKKKILDQQRELARYNNGRVILLAEIEALKKKLSGAQETMRDLWRLDGECTAELAQRVKESIGGG